jgi:hypothetical protein
VRGAIQPLIGKKRKEGKEKTKDYRKLSLQINNIEAALKNNPVFKRHDILGSNERLYITAIRGV